MKYRLLCSAMLMCSALALTGCDCSNSAENVNRTSVLDGKASVIMPEGYKRMPDDMLARKYTQEAQRPNEAWYVESEGGKVSIAFSMTANAMKESQLPEFAGMMKKQLGAFSPEVSEGIVSGKRVQRLQVTTPDATTPGRSIYNVMQFSSLDGKLLITTFNSTTDLKDKYATAGVEALSSLKY